MLRSRQQLQAVVRGAPDGFGARPADYRYDVIFLRDPLSSSEALESVPAKAGVDQVVAGSGVMPVYKRMTIRNWNTTTRLLALMEARDAL